ncbi:MAG: SDR family oxidoreductase [Spirochaetes bacterium]|nr:SDR family oxidoreductase [Spirochaetota bacterium]
MTYLDEMFGLDDKIIIITGGGGIIANAIAEGLLKAKAKVIIWDIVQEAIDQTIERLTEITGEKNNVKGLIVDTTNEESIEKSINETEKFFGPPNVLINGAGGNRGKSAFIDTNISQFEFVLRLNLIAGLVVPTKAMAKYWIKKNIKGSIINMTSMASYVPLSGVWAYDASKAGVLNLTMATAKELAPNGIRVNAIAPGFFVGKQNKDLLIKNEKTGELTERGQSIIQRTPFGRFGDASELIGAAIFLISDMASGFITGVSIPVDGGFLVDCI